MPALIDEPPAVKAEDCLDFVPDGPQQVIQFVRSSLETRRVFAKLKDLLGRDDIPRVFPGTQPSLFDKEAVQKVCPPGRLGGRGGGGGGFGGPAAAAGVVPFGSRRRNGQGADNRRKGRDLRGGPRSG